MSEEILYKLYVLTFNPVTQTIDREIKAVTLPEALKLVGTSENSVVEFHAKKMTKHHRAKKGDWE